MRTFFWSYTRVQLAAFSASRLVGELPATSAPVHFTPRGWSRKCAPVDEDVVTCEGNPCPSRLEWEPLPVRNQMRPPSEDVRIVHTFGVGDMVVNDDTLAEVIRQCGSSIGVREVIDEVCLDEQCLYCGVHQIPGKPVLAITEFLGGVDESISTDDIITYAIPPEMSSRFTAMFAAENTPFKEETSKACLLSSQ